MTNEVEGILRFWLHEVGPETWYDRNSDFDAEIRERFEELWRQAGNGALDRWLLSPKCALALIILLDQFPRNMFRGTAAAFRTDPKARAVAKLAIGRGHDKVTDEPERQFFYLPLMHSEALTDQERCVRLLKLTMPGTPQLQHARQHREVIRKFGRFPSRNGPLGRHDTEAEQRYRASGGYMS